MLTIELIIRQHKLTFIHNLHDAESYVLRIRARHCSVVPANFVICIIVGVTCMHPGRIIDYSSYTSKMCFNDFSNVDAAYLLPVLSTVFF